MAIDHESAMPSDPSGAVWWPDAATAEGANLTRFMSVLGVDSFEALNQRASQDPAWFTAELIRFLDYRFTTPWERVLDLAEGLPFAHRRHRAAADRRARHRLDHRGRVAGSTWPPRTAGRPGATTGGTSSPQARPTTWPPCRPKPCRPTIRSC